MDFHRILAGALSPIADRPRNPEKKSGQARSGDYGGGGHEPSPTF